jgi:hypothetical protein
VTQLVIFTWRDDRSGQTWQSERTTHDIPAARKRIRRDLAGKGRLLFAKVHTGTGYANRGRFV